jgi:hypothetical protein
VSFNTAAAGAGASLGSFSCPFIWDTTVSNKVLDNTGQTYITCSGTAATVTGAATSISLKVTAAAASSTTGSLRPSSTVYAAALLGVPFLAALCWFGSKKSPRRNLFRFLGLIVLLLGLSYATGCGGGFTPPPPPPVTGISAGTYLVQVVGNTTDSTGAAIKAYAEVPLVVVPTH